MKEIKAKSAKKFKLRFFLSEYEPAFFMKEVDHAELVIPRIGEAVYLPPKTYDPNDLWSDGHKYRVTDVEYPDLAEDVAQQDIDITVRDVTREEMGD